MIARTLFLFLAIITLAACAAPGVSEPAAALPPTEAAPTAAPSATPVVVPAQPPVEEPAAQPAPEEPDPAAILGNLTYTASGLWPEPVTLVDGTGSYDDGSATRPTVVLQDYLTPTADLDGDGTTDAIALLVNNASGSGTFTLLAAVFDLFGTPRPSEPVMIGDRINLKALTISDPTGDAGPTVLADMITQGPDDAFCCASWNGRMTLGLEDGRLVEQDFTLLSHISLADLDGTTWRLVDLDRGEAPVPDDITVTAVFSDGELSGSAGCNAYSAMIETPDARPNAMAVTSVSATDMLCDDATMVVEVAYLSHLPLVESWTFESGRLILTYVTDGRVYHQLLYEPAP